MDPENDYLFISDDDEPAPKRRNFGLGNPDKAPLPGLTAIGGAGKASKNRKAKKPDGPVANPLDIFPFGAEFKDPPELDSVMDGIFNPNHAVDKATAQKNHMKACLSKVRELFPDVCKKHVIKLYDDRMKGFSTFRKHENDFADLDPSALIVEHLLDEGVYPKEADDRKRKRDDIPGAGAKAPVELNHDATKSPTYLNAARKMLETEFPRIPSAYVRLLLVRNKTLTQTYATLETSDRNYTTAAVSGYHQLKKERKAIADAEMFQFLPRQGPERNQLVQEFYAAREKRKEENETRIREEEYERREADNLKQQTELGAIVECQCCFADIPLNRTIHCEGNDGHFFCYGCIQTTAKNQLGLMKFEMKCFDTSGCESGFGKSQLREAVSQDILDKLDYFQQRHEIDAAGIEGLQECPFCDFRAICPPVEEDREFRCFNPECMKVSCRLCNLPSHIPKTCIEARKEQHLSARHLVEEAMSEALIRKCPKCNVNIVKQDGCNKMQCVKCKTLMCYVCKKDITGKGYNHFDQGQYGPPEPGKCSVYDIATLDRHKEEVTKAKEAAILRATGENPDITKEDVEVDYSSDRGHGMQQEARPAPWYEDVQLLQLQMPQQQREELQRLRLQRPRPQRPNPPPAQNHGAANLLLPQLDGFHDPLINQRAFEAHPEIPQNQLLGPGVAYHAQAFPANLGPIGQRGQQGPGQQPQGQQGDVGGGAPANQGPPRVFGQPPAHFFPDMVHHHHHHHHHHHRHGNRQQQPAAPQAAPAQVRPEPAIRAFPDIPHRGHLLPIPAAPDIPPMGALPAFPAIPARPGRVHAREEQDMADYIYGMPYGRDFDDL
ncbi:hypothetical protein FQN54_003260 [Arachnomyces sp. PD_36]|nr:hypothetical protein FQN54_003260 [Arachnomyces sp. PD_36]